MTQRRITEPHRKTSRIPSATMIGRRFGRLVVVAYAPDIYSAKKMACICQCGTRCHVVVAQLNNGHTKSCGCLQKELHLKSMLKHGESKTRLYKLWTGMMQRCFNRKSPLFKRYGGRGISVCKKWWSFPKFLADMGERPDGMSLDRIKNNRGYSKLNCRWATKLQQTNNTRSNRFIIHNGQRRTMAEWGRILGIGGHVIAQRLYAGDSEERALRSL
jgi:hypothetical protein